MLVNKLSRSQHSKAEAISTPSDDDIIGNRENVVGEVSGGVVNVGRASRRSVSPKSVDWI